MNRPDALPRSDRRLPQDDELLPLSALEHDAYCPRQAALIHVDGLWRDNRHTVRGVAGHDRVDHDRSRQERGRMVLRGVAVWSHQHRLIGRCDVLEVWPDGRLVPVEYKIGTRHGRAAEIQLAGQALCLEEMTGRPIPVGYVWYARHQDRDRIAIDDDLRAATMEAVERLHSTIASGVLPPAPNDERCYRCQLRDICMPQVIADTLRFDAYMSRRFLRG